MNRRLSFRAPVFAPPARRDRAPLLMGLAVAVSWFAAIGFVWVSYASLRLLGIVE